MEDDTLFEEEQNAISLDYLSTDLTATIYALETQSTQNTSITTQASNIDGGSTILVAFSTRGGFYHPFLVFDGDGDANTTDDQTIYRSGPGAEETMFFSRGSFETSVDRLDPVTEEVIDYNNIFFQDVTADFGVDAINGKLLLDNYISSFPITAFPGNYDSGVQYGNDILDAFIGFQKNLY